jgi:hypothetical protein
MHVIAVTRSLGVLELEQLMAKKLRPASRLTLRRGAQVMREWLPKPL